MGFNGVIDYGQYDHYGHHGCCGCGSLGYPQAQPNTWTAPPFAPTDLTWDESWKTSDRWAPDTVEVPPVLTEGGPGILARIFGEDGPTQTAPVEKSAWFGRYGVDGFEFRVEAETMWSGRGPEGDLWVSFHNGEEKIAEFVKVQSWMKEV